MNKIGFKKLTVFLLMLFTGLSVSAQQGRHITLEEAIQLSLQNSNQLRLSKVRIQEATAVLKEAREKRLPDASITGSYIRLNEPTIDLKVKTGGDKTNNGEGEATTSSTPSVTEAAYTIANVSLPLFSGFKLQYGIQSAKYLEQAARLDADKDREEVIENTIAAYSNLYKARSALDLVNENLKQSRHRVQDFTHLEENGLLARNDLLKAQLQQSNVELTLLDAENNWKLTYINMNLMLGLQEDTELLPDTASFVKVDDSRVFTDWEALALQNRKDAEALDARTKAAELGVKSAKGDYYPSLALTGGYIAAYIPNLITITNAVNVGVGLKYSPSSLWKTGSKVAQAKARVQEMEVNRDLLNDNIRLQTAQAYQNYLSLQKKIDVYAQAVEQASENYRIVKNKYDNSLATAADLLDADVAELQSRLNFAFAKADAIVAYKKLQQTAGVLDIK